MRKENLTKEKSLHVASFDEIKSGNTADIYFQRCKEVLEKYEKCDKRVVADVTATSFPFNWKWAIFAGLEEILILFEGVDCDIYAMEEGTVFYPYQPVMEIEGKYCNFGLLETALLGLICQSSGIATRAARCKVAAKGKPIYSFGIRRIHPSISPMVDRSAYIGGCDGVSGISGARLIGIDPVGTMSHAYVILMESQEEAWIAFDKVMPEKIPRIALTDTYFDEKTESIMAAESLKDRLLAVRLDTPGSRRGDFKRIVEEVRWELDIRGYEYVKILISGGIDEFKIKDLRDIADYFGVGTFISGSPPIDYAMDIVEVENVPCAKRGKYGGKKQVFRCSKCNTDILAYRKDEKEKTCKCGGTAYPLLKKVLEKGEIIVDLPSPDEIRRKVLSQISKLTLE
ncbi:MAG: nicotinate phosphoribosyltransferase [Candidatus Hydrothermarchaeota archaeon]